MDTSLGRMRKTEAALRIRIGEVELITFVGGLVLIVLYQ